MALPGRLLRIKFSRKEDWRKRKGVGRKRKIWEKKGKGMEKKGQNEREKAKEIEWSDTFGREKK